MKRLLTLFCVESYVKTICVHVLTLGIDVDNNCNHSWPSLFKTYVCKIPLLLKIKPELFWFDIIVLFPELFKLFIQKLIVHFVELFILNNLILNQVLYEFTNTNTFWIGNRPQLDSQFIGYLSQFIFVDNQALTPSSFGTLINNTWVVNKYTGTFGPNGWYLDFSNASDPGLDISGNNNNWTISNISLNNIVTNNICPQIYYPNVNLIITSDLNLPCNAYNITYSLNDGNGNIININRIVSIINS